MKNLEMMTNFFVGRTTTRLAAIFLLFAVLNPLHLQAQSDRRDDASYKDFIDGVGEMLYFLAWPSAMYERVSFEGVSSVSGGADVKVKLHGKSSFSEEHLWTEVVVEIRNGEIRDIRWGRNNAILAQPGTTITAFGEVLEELNAEYERSQGSNGSSSYSTGSVTISRGLSIQSKCDKEISVAVLYFDGKGNWVRKGWFNVSHNKTINTGIVTSNDSIYFYAQGSGLQWNGEGRSGSVSRTVINSSFYATDDDSLAGPDLRNASFFHMKMAGSGLRYIQPLSCDHRH